MWNRIVAAQEALKGQQSKNKLLTQNSTSLQHYKYDLQEQEKNTHRKILWANFLRL